MGFLSPKKPKSMEPAPKPAEVTVDDDMADPDAVNRANERLRASKQRTNRQKLRIPLSIPETQGSGLQLS